MGDKLQPKPRIGTSTVTEKIEIYNGNYAPSGQRIGNFDKPWTVMAPDAFGMCASHQEAIEYALGIEPSDPTPQDRESVTTGWAPKPDHADAWAEKQELTR